MHAKFTAVCVVVFFTSIVFCAPPPQGSNITIQVNDAATGDPIAQADVYAGNDHTTTDDFGQCALTLPGRGQFMGVRVSKKGYVDMGAEWRDLKPGEKLPSQLTFNMAPGTSMGGKVVDENGQPVSGVTVHLIGGGGYERAAASGVHSTLDAHVQTDSNGKWSTGSAPTDLKQAYYRVTGAGYYSVNYYSNVPSVQQLRDKTAVFTVAHAASLTGTVLDPAGKPLQGAVVDAGEEGMGGSVHHSGTDAAGQFSLKNLHTGPVSFAVFSHQFAPEIVTVTAPATQPTVVNLKPGKTMKFHVIDKAGQPLNGVSLKVSQWKNAQFIDFTFRTDASGDAVWNGAPDDAVQMTVTKPHFGSIVDKPFKASDSPINLTLGPPTRVTGTVTDATGAPVTNFTVTIGLVWRNSDQVYWETQDMGMAPTIQADGHFRFTPRQPYPGYELRVQAPGYEPSDSQQFDTNAGELSLPFKLQKGTGIGGTVFDSKHQPVPNANVYMASPGRAFQVATHGVIPEWNQGTPVQADARGHYEFAPQVDAFDLICITDDGMARLDVPSLHPQKESNHVPPWALAPERPTTRPGSYDLQIQEWATVQGKMLVGNKPANKVEIQLQTTIMNYRQGDPQVWFNYTDTTDSSGSFTFDHVPPGDLRLGRPIHIQNSSQMAENIPVHCEPGATAKVQIGGAGREVVGKFSLPADIKPHGWLAWGATVRAHLDPPTAGQMPLMIRLGSDEAKKKWQQQLVKQPQYQAYMVNQKKAIESGALNGFGLWVDPDGSFHIDNVPPGSYDLTAQIYPSNVMQTFAWGTPLATIQKRIEVPEGNIETPVDIGAISVTR